MTMPWRVGIATTIFVGTEYDKDSVPIVDEERADIRHKIMAKAVERFDGVTIISADGAWVNDAGKVIEEKVMQVIVYSPGGSNSIKMGRFVWFILSVSRQASVLVDSSVQPEARLVFAGTLGMEGIEHA